MPTSMPERRSVAEQRADLAEDVQVGVADADRHGQALGERLLDGVLHHVGDAVHGLTRGGAGGPDGGEVAGARAAPALLGVALRDDEALGTVAVQRFERAGEAADATASRRRRLAEAGD